MEFEDVSEEVEWECKRVAAAFGMSEWQQSQVHIMLECQSQLGNIIINWHIDSRDGTLHLIHIYDFSDETSIGEQCSVHLSDYWKPSNLAVFVWAHVYKSLTNPWLDELMARGVYRLGIEDEDVLAELNHPLTAHEKLELRLSMPREFWPQKWLDEEAH